MQNGHSASVDSKAELARALIKALGLPQNVTKLTLTMAAGKPVLVECQVMPEIESGGIADVGALAGRFELVALNEGAGYA